MDDCARVTVPAQGTWNVDTWMSMDSILCNKAFQTGNRMSVPEFF